MTVSHECERLVQKRVGMESIAITNGRMIQNFIPQGLRIEWAIRVLYKR